MVESYTPSLVQLFSTFTVLAVIVGVIVLSLMAYLVIRFRAKASTPEPEDTPQLGRIPQARGHLKTVIVSLSLSSIVLGVLIFGTFSVTDQITNIPTECSQPPSLQTPSPCLTIGVTAFRFGWNFTYPDGQTLLGNLTVPTGRIVILEIMSQDVYHSFRIEGFKIAKDAIPGLSTTIWGIADEQTSRLIRCVEFCGLGHAGMTAKMSPVSGGSFQGFCSSSGC